MVPITGRGDVPVNNVSRVLGGYPSLSGFPNNPPSFSSNGASFIGASATGPMSGLPSSDEPLVKRARTYAGNNPYASTIMPSIDQMGTSSIGFAVNTRISKAWHARAVTLDDKSRIVPRIVNNELMMVLFDPQTDRDARTELQRKSLTDMHNANSKGLSNPNTRVKGYLTTLMGLPTINYFLVREAATFSSYTPAEFLDKMCGFLGSLEAHNRGSWASANRNGVVSDTTRLPELVMTICSAGDVEVANYWINYDRLPHGSRLYLVVCKLTVEQMRKEYKSTYSNADKMLLFRPANEEMFLPAKADDMFLQVVPAALNPAGNVTDLIKAFGKDAVLLQIGRLMDTNNVQNRVLGSSPHRDTFALESAGTVRVMLQPA